MQSQFATSAVLILLCWSITGVRSESIEVAEDLCIKPKQCQFPFSFDNRPQVTYTSCVKLAAQQTGMGSNRWCFTPQKTLVNCDTVTPQNCAAGGWKNQQFINNKNCPPGTYFQETNKVFYRCIPCAIGTVCPGGDVVRDCPEAKKPGMAICPPLAPLRPVLPGGVVMVSGDPHQRLWNGVRTNYMGSSYMQYYGVTRCAGRSVDVMPFNVIVKHFGYHPVNYFNYAVVELFELNKRRHLLFLMPRGIAIYENAPASVSTMYAGLPVYLNSARSFGRFRIRYGGGEVWLWIDGRLVTRIMSRLYYMSMTPPVGFRSAACGMFGDFYHTGKQMLDCAGQVRNVFTGYDYSTDGWSWNVNTCRRGVNVIADESSYVPLSRSNGLRVRANVQSSPCPGGSRDAAAAKIECNKVHKAYQQKKVCTGILETQLCQSLLSDCYVDACVVGHTRAKTAAKVQFGTVLKEIEKNAATYRILVNPARRKIAPKALFVCGSLALNPIRRRTPVRGNLQVGATSKKLAFGRIIACGIAKDGVLVPYLNGFSLVPKKSMTTLDVSRGKITGKGSANAIILSSMNKAVTGVATSYLGTCGRAKDQIRAFSVKMASNFGQNDHVMERRVLQNFACARTKLRGFVGIQSISLKNTVETGIGFEVLAPALTLATQNEVDVEVEFMTTSKTVLNLAAGVMVFCAEPKKGLGPKHIQTGEFGFDLQTGNGKMSMKQIGHNVTFSEAMECMNPQVALSLLQVSLGRGSTVDAQVVENSPSPFGFSVIVSAGKVHRIGQMNLGWIAMCS